MQRETDTAFETRVSTRLIELQSDRWQCLQRLDQIDRTIEELRAIARGERFGPRN